jgi:hypothetical protein
VNARLYYFRLPYPIITMFKDGISLVRRMREYMFAEFSSGYMEKSFKRNKNIDGRNILKRN